MTGKNRIDETVKYVTNPYDEYAVEQALQVKESTGTGEVVVVSVGPEAALHTVRAALALGADRGILIRADAPFIDSRLVSRALRKAIRQDGSPDLILTGKQSVDTEGMQTHFRLAAGFNMPVATDVAAFTLDDGRVIVEREIGGGAREVVRMTLPCVVGVTRGLNEPRHPKLADILKAKQKEIRRIDIDALQPDSTFQPMEMLELRPAPEKEPATMIDGDPRRMARELVDLLKQKAKVL
jgi:electron transfer flavoprotein beta subunit